jgi:capsular exopolysaccharide synthesis family protein
VPESGLSQYLRVLRRNLWIVILVTALVTATTYYMTSRQAKIYESSADVFLGTQSLANALGAGASQSDPFRQSVTQANLARTIPVARRALRAAGLSDRRPEQLLGNSSVTPASNADILTFKVEDRNPKIATRLAAAYARAYTQYRKQLDTSSIDQALKDVSTRLEQLRQAGLDKTTAYADLLDNQQRLSTLQLLQGSNASLVRSSLGATQVRPRPLRDSAIAAALGLFLGIGLAFLREAMDTRVRSVAEAQQRLELPLLARIPEPPRRFRGQNRLVMMDEPHSPAAEAFRILATNLDFVNLERGARTIMFTSATHSEGKTTTIANLAVALARANRRVALLDLDLRKPSVARMFGLDDEVGLTSVALGRRTMDEALVHIPLGIPGGGGTGSETALAGSLLLLPVGPPPPNPGEFIGSNALGAILADLESRADLVLVDTPPLLNLSDSMTLTSRVDGLVVVVKLPAAKRSVLQELRRVLDAAPIAKLGFVATGSASDADGYGAYGYGHAYGRVPQAWPADREGAPH